MSKISATLRQRYIEKLKEKIAELEQLSFPTALHNKTCLNTLQTHAHKLAGTGTTYGFPSVSAAARALDDLLNNGETDAEAIKPYIDILIDACKAACNEAILTPPSVNGEDKNFSTPHRVNKPHIILVADDDENIRNIAKILFDDVAQIITAQNSDEAMTQIVQYRPDLILLDDMMPGGISGLGLLEQIEKSEYAFIPVIMVTSSRDAAQIIRGVSAGAVDYIVKPFDPDKLSQKVRARLSRLEHMVLISDDDEMVRNLLSSKFRSAGYRVACAEDGVRAWNIMQIKTPNLVILDWMMPGYDGMELVRMMKSSRDLANVPVVFLTARHFSENAIEGLEAGAAEYIAKPFNPDEVIARCVRHIEIAKAKNVA